MELNNRGYLSFSQLQTVANCGEMYRRKYMGTESVDFQHSVYSLVGSAFHEAIVDYELSIESTMYYTDWDSDVAVLVQYTKDRIRKMIEDQEIDREKIVYYGNQDLAYWYKNKIKVIAKAYLDFRKIEVEERDFRWGIPDWFAGSAGMSLETPFKVEIAGQQFIGAVDQIYFDSQKRLVLRDIKTGKPKPGHAMQLEQYRLAIKRQFGVDANYGQVLYLSGKTAHPQVVDFTLSDDQVEEATARLVKSAQEGLFIVNGPWTGSCDLCDFRSSCHYGQVGTHGSS